jgi:hypothetical protein
MQIEDVIAYIKGGNQLSDEETLEFANLVEARLMEASVEIARVYDHLHSVHHCNCAEATE